MPIQVLQLIPVSDLGATTQCHDCSIFIGPGHTDDAPHWAPDGLGILCSACWRLAARRFRAARGDPTVVWEDPE